MWGGGSRVGCMLCFGDCLSPFAPKALATITAGQGNVSVGLMSLHSVKPTSRSSQPWQNRGKELLLPRSELGPPAGDRVEWDPREGARGCCRSAAGLGSRPLVQLSTQPGFLQTPSGTSALSWPWAQGLGSPAACCGWLDVMFPGVFTSFLWR